MGPLRETGAAFLLFWASCRADLLTVRDGWGAAVATVRRSEAGCLTERRSRIPWRFLVRAVEILMTKVMLAISIATAFASPVAAQTSAVSCALETFKACRAACEQRYSANSTVLSGCIEGCRIATRCR